MAIMKVNYISVDVSNNNTSESKDLKTSFLIFGKHRKK